MKPVKRIENKMIETFKKTMIYIASAFSFIVSRGMFYATETDLGNKVTTVSGKFLSEFKAMYCGSLCWLLLGIQLTILFFSHNDKLVGFAKKALIGCICLFIALQMLVKTDGGAIGNTITTISTWAGG